MSFEEITAAIQEACTPIIKSIEAMVGGGDELVDAWERMPELTETALSIIDETDQAYGPNLAIQTTHLTLKQIERLNEGTPFGCCHTHALPFKSYAAETKETMTYLDKMLKILSALDIVRRDIGGRD